MTQLVTVKSDPILVVFSAIVVVGIGVLVYTGKVSWEIGAAFLALQIFPSLLGRKETPNPPAALLLVLALSLTACPKPSSGNTDVPNIPNLTDAGGRVVGGVCDLIEGVDSSGTLRNVCATAEEIINMIGFITSLRSLSDSGLSATGPCDPLPRTEFCATSNERARAIQFVVRTRASRLVRDGGQ